MKKEFKVGRDCIGVGGGVFIFNKNKEVLLLKRSINAKNEKGWWCKPGGEVDFGETSIVAMKREIKEEIGIEIDIWGMLPNTDHILKKEGQHWLAFNFLANIKKGTSKIIESHKFDDMQWFAMDKLPKKTTKTTREPARNYLEKKYIKL